MPSRIKVAEGITPAVGVLLGMGEGPLDSRLQKAADRLAERVKHADVSLLPRPGDFPPQLWPTLRLALESSSGDAATVDRLIREIDGLDVKHKNRMHQRASRARVSVQQSTL